jgi:hypothetical protein
LPVPSSWRHGESSFSLLQKAKKPFCALIPNLTQTMPLCLGHSLCADLPVLTDRSNFTFELKWLFRFLTRISVKNPIHRSFLFPCHGFCAYLISSRQKFWVSGFRDSRCREPQSSRSPDLRYPEIAETASTVFSPHGYLLVHVTTIPYDRSPMSFAILGFQMPKRMDPLSSGFPILRIPISRNGFPFGIFLRKPRLLPRVPSRWMVLVVS